MDENKQSFSLNKQDLSANKLKAIIEGVINKAVKPINERLGGIEARLDDPDTGLKRLNDRMDANTTAVMELEKTVKGYGDMYKINDNNIRKMEKRLETVEEDAGIEIPPELRLADVA